MKIKYSDKNKGKMINSKNGEIKVDPFTPDSDLLKFAEWFSNNHKLISAGMYYSHDKKYSIDYIERKDETVGKRNFAIGHTTKSMIFTKEALNDYSGNYIFYIVLWLAYFGTLIGKEPSSENKRIFITDKAVLDYYLTCGRSIINIMVDFIQSVSQKLPISELNIGRIESYKNKLS